MESYQEYTEIRADKRFGQPCIKGTRIRVADILAMLPSDMSVKDILEDFPELKADQVKAALHFAANREQSMRIAS